MSQIPIRRRRFQELPSTGRDVIMLVHLLTTSASALFGKRAKPFVVKRQSYLQDLYMSVCANKPSADRLGSFQTGSSSQGKSLFCRSCTTGGATDMQMNPFPSNPDACVCIWRIKTPLCPFSEITINWSLKKKKTTATMNYFAHQRETGQFQRCF